MGVPPAHPFWIILIGFSIINHLSLGIPILGTLQMVLQKKRRSCQVVSIRIQLLNVDRPREVQTNNYYPLAFRDVPAPPPPPPKKKRHEFRDMFFSGDSSNKK